MSRRVRGEPYERFGGGRLESMESIECGEYGKYGVRMNGGLVQWASEAGPRNRHGRERSGPGRQQPPPPSRTEPTTLPLRERPCAGRGRFAWGAGFVGGGCAVDGAKMRHPARTVVTRTSRSDAWPSHATSAQTNATTIQSTRLLGLLPVGPADKITRVYAPGLETRWADTRTGGRMHSRNGRHS